MIRLRDVLEEKKISQKDLADMIGISTVAMSNIVKGKTDPSLKTLKAISMALDIEMIELFKTGNNYSHFYDDTTGCYLGVRMKLEVNNKISIIGL